MSIPAFWIKARVVRRAMMLIFVLVMSCATTSAQTSKQKRSQNHPPTVILKASPTTLCYGGEVELLADAKDPDGDRLTYKYTTGEGQIIGQGRRVRWRLGGMGQYKVEVEVSDGRGGVASSLTWITIFELCSCPSITMDGLVETLRTRPLVTFRLSLSGGVIYSKPTFSWSVSAGKIIKGKSKSVITVDTTGVEAENINATVKIGGLAPECDMVESFTVKNPSHQAP
jgi:hypothetical protein